MKKLDLNDVLFITDEFERELSLAARNLSSANVITAHEINPIILLQYENICVTKKTVTLLEEKLS